MKKLCLNEFLLSLLVSDLEKRPLVVHFQTIEYSLAKQKVMDSSSIRGNAFTEIFQEFLMTGQEKCGKFECGQNQRRQLLEQFNKV